MAWPKTQRTTGRKHRFPPFLFPNEYSVQH
nr:MAG TPA: hypothetical protein [Caudoviricetes sp.]